MMKYLLTILLFAPFGLMAQFGSTDTTDHPYFGEYFNMLYKASTHQVYDILSVVPHLCTGQPAYVSEIYGGPHDGACIGPVAPGNLYMMGSIFGGAGSFTNITVDSAGNALPAVTEVYLTGNNTSPFWDDVIVTTDSTTGRQVGIAGQLNGGMHGNGTNTNVNQTSFVWVNFPINVHILKVCGLYGLKALDSKGRVWSWGYANNKAQLSRGTSPTVSYLSPDTIVLPAGRHAIDIADAGNMGVILLDDHEVLGTGDHPTLWGGSGQGSSNTPQNFTTFLTTSLGTDVITGQAFSPAKVFCNTSAVYYIGVDSTLGASGDNICGQIGNGKMFPMNTYTFAPAPTGGTLAPYAYDNGLGPTGVGEFPQSTPVRICIGTHNWEYGYMGPSNCWNANFVNNKHEIWVMGRGKAGQIMDNRASCNYISGGLNGTYPDMVNMPYPLKISPFSITSGTLVTPTCFYCIANPGAASCSQGTGCYNGSLAAPIVNGNKQVLASTITAATITPSITYASGSKEYLNIVTFSSGPNTPIMPFNTGSTINVSGLIPGTYIFKDSSTDIMWKTGVSNDTIIVGGSIGPIIKGQPVILTKADSVYSHSLLVTDANYYTLDTLTMPINSTGLFDLFFFAYDTLHHFTGTGEEKIMLARIGSVYQAPYPCVEALCIITLICAAFVLAEFIRSKDGELRKIMITYFSIELFIFGTGGAYLWLYHFGKEPMLPGLFLIMLIVPKVAVKLWLRRWQIENKS